MEPKENIPTLKSYVLGYAFSLLLTLLIFGIAYLHLQSDHTFIAHKSMRSLISVFALAQLLVQTIFFLHLSTRKEEHTRLMTYLFTIYTVAFIVIGSIWIMNNLNDNMSPEQVAKYLHNED